VRRRGSYLRDSGLLKTKRNRDRVVCVMTTGQEWQFRPYKWSEPKELFHHGQFYREMKCYVSQADSCVSLRQIVKGIHFQWTNDAPNPKISGWNVTNLKVCFMASVARYLYDEQTN
jgi:hypothetical protein